MLTSGPTVTTANWMMSLPSRREVANTIAAATGCEAGAKDQHASRRPQMRLLTMLIFAALVLSRVNPASLLCRMLPRLIRKPSNLIRTLRLPGHDSASGSELPLLQRPVDPNVNSPAAVKEAADRAIALGARTGRSMVGAGNLSLSRLAQRCPRALEAYHEAEKRLPNSALVNRIHGLLRSAALVTGEKLKRISRGRSSLTHATPGFGPHAAAEHISAVRDDGQRLRQHSIGRWKFRLTISSSSR